ncbi:MAG: nucleotidyl transferase AbiEii/AbiGii toxin family protein [Bacteroidales bacterium]|nr:nucleotidyl transferase AbiEii/AbiGii toxin family protein [Bacteroidales bacterium]
MQPSPKYYERILYPLQDKVLKALNELDTGFYLTGGTALSRAYLSHRYSDDLDFFLNQAEDFHLQVQKSVDTLRANFHDKVEVTLTADTFVRIFINEPDASLKLEFVNDVSFRHGEPIETVLYKRTDNPRNILSNKIGALSRREAKDLVDIIEIARKYPFNWKEVIAEAKMKDMWVDESEVILIINEFPISRLEEIKWIQAYNPEQFKQDITIVLNDLFTGRDNSLSASK